jgi:glucuronate isomerase
MVSAYYCCEYTWRDLYSHGQRNKETKKTSSKREKFTAAAEKVERRLGDSKIYKYLRRDRDD